MLLGDLIAHLKTFDQAAYVGVDASPVALVPAAATSYRGFYEDLALTLEPERHAKVRCVAHLVALLEGVLGTVITGYLRRGEYMVTTRTRVWLTNYGEASGACVTGARIDSWGVVALTWEQDREP